MRKNKKPGQAVFSFLTVRYIVQGEEQSVELDRFEMVKRNLIQRRENFKYMDADGYWITYDFTPLTFEEQKHLVKNKAK